MAGGEQHEKRVHPTTLRQGDILPGCARRVTIVLNRFRKMAGHRVIGQRGSKRQCALPWLAFRTNRHLVHEMGHDQFFLVRA